MIINFCSINIGQSYSRNQLAKLWGYSGFQALARGVVTPKADNKIILFVTAENQNCVEIYNNRLKDGILLWEGPTDHYAEDRMIQARINGDELHLFYRQRRSREVVPGDKLG